MALRASVISRGGGPDEQAAATTRSASGRIRAIVFTETPRLRIPGLLPEFPDLDLEIVGLPAQARGLALQPFRVGPRFRGRRIGARLFQAPAGSLAVPPRR